MRVPCGGPALGVVALDDEFPGVVGDVGPRCPEQVRHDARDERRVEDQVGARDVVMSGRRRCGENNRDRSRDGSHAGALRRAVELKREGWHRRDLVETTEAKAVSVVLMRLERASQDGRGVGAGSAPDGEGAEQRPRPAQARDHAGS